MNLFNDDKDITYGADAAIWKSFEKSFEKGNKEVYNVLNKFVWNVLSSSVENNSVKHFEKYILFFPSCYYVTYQKAKQSPQLNDFHQYVKNRASMNLKEILSYNLNYKKKFLVAKDLESLEEQNLFIYRAFNSFSRLLYLIANNGDVTFFEETLNEFDQIDSLGYNHFNDLRIKIKYYPEKGEEFEKVKQFYEVVSKYHDYKRHVITGIKFWIYFLYSVKRNNLHTTLALVDKLHIRADSEDMLKDIISLRTKSYTNYFEWSGWDFKERMTGKHILLQVQEIGSHLAFISIY